MLVRGKNIDNLTAFGEEFQDFAIIDNAHIEILSARGRYVWRDEKAAIH